VTGITALGSGRRIPVGLDLSYVASNDQLDIRLSQADWNLLNIVGKSCPNELEIISGVEDFGEERREKRLELLKAVETVLERLNSDSARLRYVYELAIVEGPYAGVTGSGMVSGIRIGEDGFVYAIEGGLGRCNLIKQGVGPDGWGIDLEKKDIRGLETLQTDNLGEIKITRKKKGTRLKEALKQIKDFLSRNPDENIAKILG
jgi:hypothetical protein